MAKTVTLKDTSTNEQVYPITLLDNVIASDGTSIANYISSLMNYGNVTFSINTTTSSGGTLSLDGTIPLHVVTLTGNVSALSLSTNPVAGHSCHIILTAASEYTVAIAHDATNRICPEGKSPDPFTIPAGGYVEINFLNIGNKIYVRGI